MSLLTELKKALETVDKHVCYGKCFDSYINEFGWDLIVFNRKSLKKKRHDIYREFEVHIIRESCIDDGLDIDVIKAVEKQTTLRLINEQEMQYNYIRKGESDDVIEILTLSFAKTDTCQV